MRDRCNNPNNKSFKHYGGRGIKVCKEWDKDFMNFYTWAMDNGYKEGLTLDREEVNGNYEPSNCSWKTNLEQQRNRRNNHYVTINGETKTISEWSEISGIPPKTLRHRIISGWDENELFNDVYEATKVEVNGELKTFHELHLMSGIRTSTIMKRYTDGKRDVELIAPSTEVHTIEIRGEKLTIRETWEKYGKDAGISFYTVKNRFHQGWSGEEIIKPNKTRNVTVNGVTHSVNKWSEITGISNTVLRKRYDEGIIGEEFLAEPKKKPLAITINGETKSARQWALTAGVTHNTILKRYKKGLRGEDLISPTTSKKPNNDDSEQLGLPL